MKNSKKSNSHKNIVYTDDRTVEIFKKGISVVAPHHMQKGIQPKHLKDTKRGKISTFSAHSKKRMREFLLTHTPPDEWLSFGVTLTVPGDEILNEKQSAALWHYFTDRIKRAGMGCVWRKELQTRKQVHWHCLFVSPAEVSHGYAPRRTVAISASQWIHRNWLRALDTLGKASQTVKGGTCVSVRSIMYGAFAHSVDIQQADESAFSPWERYMLDHATKSKREQIAERGRHWGVINRKVFREADKESTQMSFAASCRMMRALRKLRRCLVRDERSAFGYRHGYESKRGLRGSSVWFGNPATMAKLVEWAGKDCPSESRPASEVHPLSMYHEFWRIYPLTEKIRSLVATVQADPVKALQPASLTEGPRISPMLPPCSSSFMIQRSSRGGGVARLASHSAAFAAETGTEFL